MKQIYVYLYVNKFGSFNLHLLVMTESQNKTSFDARATNSMHYIDE